MIIFTKPFNLDDITSNIEKTLDKKNKLELKIRDYQDQLQQKVEHPNKRNPPDFSWFHRIAGFLPLKPRTNIPQGTRGG